MTPEKLLKMPWLMRKARIMRAGEARIGTIIDETKHTFVVDNHDETTSRVIKRGATFTITEGDATITVDGSLIEKYPEDRIKLIVR